MSMETRTSKGDTIDNRYSKMEINEDIFGSNYFLFLDIFYLTTKSKSVKK